MLLLPSATSVEVADGPVEGAKRVGASACCLGVTCSGRSAAPAVAGGKVVVASAGDMAALASLAPITYGCVRCGSLRATRLPSSRPRAPDGQPAVARQPLRACAGCGATRYCSRVCHKDDWREVGGGGGGGHRRACPKCVTLKVQGTYVAGASNCVDARMAHVTTWVRTWPAQMAAAADAAGLALDDLLMLTDDAAGTVTLLSAVAYVTSRFSLGEGALAMPPSPDGRRQLGFVTVGPPAEAGAFGAELLGLEPLDSV